MGKYFGTDGVRGVANKDLTCELAFLLGQAGAHVLTRAVSKPRILIGRDTRISGDMLEAALVSGICSTGAEALIAGVLPTPAIAYLTRLYNADAGVVISASHNTVEYNGIKFFNAQGYKLSDEIEADIEEHIDRKMEGVELPVGTELGRRVTIRNAMRDYRDFLISTTDITLDGLNIVLDCANGAASEIAPQVFKELGANVTAYYNTPDGGNINEMCGSTHPMRLQQLVQELGADVGLAFDGDADRLIAVDESGAIVDGDRIMAILAMDLRAAGKLKSDTVVATVMSNMGLDIALKNNGMKIVKTAVGDRYVLERMLQDDYSLGGEQSGHIIFIEHNSTGDGILTGIQLVSAMERKRQRLSKLARVVNILPQVLVNVRLKPENMQAYMQDEAVAKLIKEVEKSLGSDGRVLIRASGTEPLVRIMIEGKDQTYIEEQAAAIKKLMKERLA